MIDRRVNERRIFALMVCFIFLFVGWFSTAKADQWTVLGGVSKFQVHDDGVWYQEAFPYNFKLTPPSVGLRYDSDGWTVGYMNLGKVTSYAKAVALDGRYPGDGGYNSATKSCNGECWPLSTWYGKGDVQGIVTKTIDIYSHRLSKRFTESCQVNPCGSVGLTNSPRL